MHLSDNAVLSDSELLVAGEMYEFQGDPSLFSGNNPSGNTLSNEYFYIMLICHLLDGIKRVQRQLLSLYVLGWATCFFLPHWTTTPALFFFLNSLALIAVDWSMKPVAALVRPWLFVTLSVVAHGLFTKATSIAVLHVCTASLILLSTYSISLSGALLVLYLAVMPSAGLQWTMKSPFA